MVRVNYHDELVMVTLLPQTKVSQLNMEQARLVQQASELEQQVSEVRHQLQEERHKCRLLMDYPFAKQTTGGVLHQKQISANTVRILLLEEQNADLRDRIAQAAKAMRLQTKDMFQVGMCGHVIGVSLCAHSHN